MAYYLIILSRASPVLKGVLGQFFEAYNRIASFLKQRCVHHLLQDMIAATLFIYGPESSHPKQVLFQSADETLCTPIALRLSKKGGRALDPQEEDLRLQRIGDVLASMIMTKRPSCGYPLGKEPEMLSDARSSPVLSSRAVSPPLRKASHPFNKAESVTPNSQETNDKSYSLKTEEPPPVCDSLTNGPRGPTVLPSFCFHLSGHILAQVPL